MLPLTGIGVPDQLHSPDWASWIPPPERKCAQGCALHLCDPYPALQSHQGYLHTCAHKIPDHRLCLDIWMIQKKKTLMLYYKTQLHCTGSGYGSNFFFFFECWPVAVFNLHLFESWASLTFSEEKVSSRSKRSSMGGGRSLKAGWKTCKQRSRENFS